MAENDLTDVRMVSSGPSFEIWAGPRGTMRLDWTKRGVVRIIVDGFGHGEFGAPTVRRYEEALRVSHKVHVVMDFWGMPKYDSPLRTLTQGWASKHLKDVEGVFVSTRSTFVSMGVAVANLAVAGIIKVFPKKDEFDRECQKLGLPVNPPMSANT